MKNKHIIVLSVLDQASEAPADELVKEVNENLYATQIEKVCTARYEIDVSIFYASNREALENALHVTFKDLDVGIYQTEVIPDDV